MTSDGTTLAAEGLRKRLACARPPIAIGAEAAALASADAPGSRGL